MPPRAARREGGVMKSRTARTVLAALAFVGITLPLSATGGDGVIEINQASVLAGAGFPYTITQPGSYRLTGLLTVPDVNTTGIRIEAEGVTLDLGGFGVVGPVTCQGDGTTRSLNTSCSASGSGIGIFVDSGGVAVIRNGFVRGMGSAGILVGGNFGSVVERVVVEENAGDGINLFLGRLADSVSRFNGGNGVHQCDCGGSGHNQIVGNVVERNRGIGIRAGQGVVQENYVFYNGSHGVYVGAGGSNGAHVTGNTIEGNDGNGINASNGVYRANMLRNNLQTSGHQVTGTISDGGQNHCSPAC
jgi:hypothetical protein